MAEGENLTKNLLAAPPLRCSLQGREPCSGIAIEGLSVYASKFKRRLRYRNRWNSKGAPCCGAKTANSASTENVANTAIETLIFRLMCNLYYADLWIMPTISSERSRAAAIAAMESA